MPRPKTISRSTLAFVLDATGSAKAMDVKQVYANVQGPKELVWASGAQIDFYDQQGQVEQALGGIWGGERTIAGRPIAVSGDKRAPS